jgi:hypothetical protein
MRAHLPRKTKNAYQRGKLVGVQICVPEDMPPDLASASAKWKVPQNRLPKMPQDAFSVGVRYHGPYRESKRPRVLVRGTAQSPDIDEFALLLQPIKDTWRNYGGRTGKLIQL